MMLQGFSAVLAMVALGQTGSTTRPAPAIDRGTAGPARRSPSSDGFDPISARLLQLSRDKWRWMAERDVAALDALIDEQAVFVHMGATMTKAQELDVIRTGRIQYKSAEVQDASVRRIGSTAVVLNRIRLTAIVGGNEVVNPFTVTEVYVSRGDSWTLVALSFTRLLGN